ncbi:hypothetical protein [Ligilactobacillus salivarius]|uniref:hypothetical protein n=1 Tax=Ligilactobacillus salivarius TaxID=1624 RepID=UPI000BAF6AAB|nr:hypothetical protein [Ligilactobacillus salivarius]PAY34607.1 hypothetical protein A8C54_08865 [Ligilactobacillus salivarius]PAY39121.1 hypothetical protein A8C34_08895 [Ligilactobacillus salivarius]PAY46925.1 hypothetical protein A8C55_06715 [Ligilactobacillus salivarius]
MRVKSMLLDDDGITYVIGETKFRYRVEQKPNIKVGQEVELVDLIRKTRPYLVMSAETEKQMGARNE